jgi:hypothetical protein
MDYIYETEDNLTASQARKFMSLAENGLGTDMELNPSPSGEPDEFYVVVFDVEEMDEVKFLRNAEKVCHLVSM